MFRRSPTIDQGKRANRAGVSAFFNWRSWPPRGQPSSAVAREAGLEPGGAELCHAFNEMGAVAGFDDEFKQRALGRQSGEGALVRDLDDVGADFRQQRGDGG